MFESSSTAKQILWSNLQTNGYSCKSFHLLMDAKTKTFHIFAEKLGTEAKLFRIYSSQLALQTSCLMPPQLITTRLSASISDKFLYFRCCVDIYKGSSGCPLVVRFHDPDLPLDHQCTCPHTMFLSLLSTVIMMSLKMCLLYIEMCSHNREQGESTSI